MTVYLDEVFALNLLIDALLLKTAAVLLGRTVPWYRVLGASLCGAVYAVLTLLPGCGFLGLVPLRLLLFALMCCLAFGFGRQALRPGLWYLGVCCGFAGLSYAVSVLCGRGVLLLGGTAWYLVSFRFLALLAGAGYLVVRLLLPKLSRGRGGQTCELTLSLGSRRTTVTALRDTGNTLRDPLTGAPVLVADGVVLHRLLPDVPLTQAQLRDPAAALALLRLVKPALKPRLLPYRAVGTDGALLLALACTASGPRKRPRPVVVAFSPTPVSSAGLYHALMGGTLC